MELEQEPEDDFEEELVEAKSEPDSMDFEFDLSDDSFDSLGSDPNWLP